MSACAPRHLLTLLIGLSMFVLSSLRADDRAGAIIPEDTCVLELTLPEGATVALDGKDQGTKQQFTFDSLTPREISQKQLSIRYPSGTTSEHTLLLQGGRRLTLAKRDPAASKLELVEGAGLPPIANYCTTPDMKYLAAGHQNGTVSIWDMQHKRLLRHFAGDELALHGSSAAWVPMAVSPDGKWLAISGNTEETPEHTKNVSRLGVYDIRTGELIRSLEDPSRWILRVAFSPDGRQILSGFADKTAILWDAATGRKLRTFQGHTEQISSVAFSPDGRRVLTGSGDKTAILWDVERGQKLRTFGEHSRRVDAVALSPDGRKAMTCSDNTAILWDAETGSKLHTFAADVRCLAFSPDGRQAIAGATKAATAWDVESGRELRTFKAPADRLGYMGAAACTSVGYSRDGQRVFLGFNYGAAVIYDVATGAELWSFQNMYGQTWAATYSADGGRLITQGPGAPTVIWDADTGRKVRTLDCAHAMLSPNGQQVLTASKETLVLRDIETGEETHTFQGDWPDSQGNGPVAFSQDGDRLATCSKNGVLLWNTTDGQRLRTLEHSDGDVSCVAFSPDGRNLAVGYSDKTVVLWDVESGKDLRVLPAQSHQLLSLAFSPDGRRIVGGSEDNTVLLWNTQDGATADTLPWVSKAVSYMNSVETVAFSPDGRLVLAGSLDGTAMLWDAKSGKSLRTIRLPSQDFIHHVSFDPSGECVRIIGNWRLLQVFDWATGELVLRGSATDEGILYTTPGGSFDGPSSTARDVCYRIGDGLNVVPVDRFYKDFYRPGLLAAILRGERPLPDVEIGKELPPKLRILSPEPETVGKRELNVVAEATDEGGGVAGFDLYQNGARLLTDGETTREGKTTRRSFPVRLVEGENVLEVRAACRSGFQESEPVSVQVRCEKAVPGAVLYLVTVGINRYADETLNLRFATADAKALADLFQRRADALYGEGKVHVQTLLDDQATKAGLEKTLAEVAKKAQPQDTLVLALSGHGLMLGSLYYFVPHEVVCRSGKPVDEEIRSQALPQYQLQDWMSRVPALKRVLILDTCQSGGAIGLGRTGRSPWKFKKAMESLSRSEGIYTIAAAAAGNEAQEVPDLGHGILTYALLAGAGAMDSGPLGRRPLKSEGEDDLLTIVQWLRYAQDKVPTLTKLYFDQQQYIEADIRGQDFPILPLEKP